MVDLNELTEHLQSIPLFSALDSSRLKLLAFTNEVLEYADEESLFLQDEGADSIFVILEGEVEIRRTDEDMETVVDRKVAGETVGEMAVLRGARRSASVIACGNVRALKISGRDFLDLVAGNPELAIFVMKDLSNRLFDTTQSLGLAAARSSQKRDQ